MTLNRWLSNECNDKPCLIVCMDCFVCWIVQASFMSRNRGGSFSKSLPGKQHGAPPTVFNPNMARYACHIDTLLCVSVCVWCLTVACYKENFVNVPRRACDVSWTPGHELGSWAVLLAMWPYHIHTNWVREPLHETACDSVLTNPKPCIHVAKFSCNVP